MSDSTGPRTPGCRGMGAIGECGRPSKYIVGNHPVCGLHVAQMVKALLRSMGNGAVVECRKVS